MCIEDVDEVIAAAQLLKAARALRESWISEGQAEPAYGAGERPLTVTHAEGVRLLDARITDAEQRIKQLGFTGKVVRVSEGDNARIMNQV